MGTSGDSTADYDLDLAIRLSKESYEKEERRRKLLEQKDLIDLEDLESKRKTEQIESITRIFESLPIHQPHVFAPPCVASSSSVPNRCFLDVPSPAPRIQYRKSETASNAAYASTAGIFSARSFNKHSNANTFHFPSITPVNGNKNLGLQSQQIVQNSSLCNTSLIVPFQPLSTRLVNGDLIDLGNEPTKAPKSPLKYEQLREEFDPLCRTNSYPLPNSSAQSNALTSSRSSTLLEEKRENPPPLFERSKSVTTTTLERAALSKPSRPPPPKPQRRKTSGRSGSADNKTRSCPVVNRKISVEDLRLDSKICELEREIASLERRRPSKQKPSARRFFSPVVDYLITNFKVTSVKVIVEKDYSWPPSVNGDEDKMTFTCETKSTIQEILANVLNTFLDAKQIEDLKGCLPIEQYGLKIFGLDEFLLNSSQLGENPFVGEALAFGRDIRLEVGKVSSPWMHKAVQEFDITNIDNAAVAITRSNTTRKLCIPLLNIKTVQEVVDTLKKEMNNCITNFYNENVSKHRKAVSQTVKLLCTILGRIMTYELSTALNAYLSASTMDELNFSCSDLVNEIHYFIDTFSRSSRCNFCVLPLKLSSFENTERTRREIVSVDEHLLVHVDSIHNIPAEWTERYHAFCAAVHVMHGTAELCRGFREAAKPLCVDSTFPYCRTNAWVKFDLPLCVLPRETRLFIILYGVARSDEEQADINMNNSSTNVSEELPKCTEKQLACASFPLFDHEGLLRQGSLLLPLGAIEGSVVQPWGPRPLFETEGDLAALVVIPRLDYDVVFPHVGFGESSLKRDFSSLDVDTQQSLMDIVEGGVTHSLNQDEKEILWEKRYYLTHLPEALTLVLASAVGWDWASLNNIYQLVDDWNPLNPVQAVELLLPHFPDVVIREKAIDWLKGASSDFLFNFLPELVEALRFETFENSPLAAYLLSLGADDRRFAFELYWQLQQRIDHCSERSFVYRCVILQKQMLEFIDDSLRVDIKNQHRLLRGLNVIAAAIKEGSEQSKLVGDDVRQDSLVLQLVKLMNDIWLSQELDLRMIVFRCMSVGPKMGMIELVSECRTLCEIQSALGATGVFKDDILKKWLEKQNPSEFQYKIALENFQLSCAGWCVATYVLGIGDRHNDNILLTKTGHVFHIDFGKYMGDWQMAAGFRRDRTPFIFTAEMAYVINEGSSQSATGQYQQFIDNCCKAFNLLRKKYSLLINLIKLMCCSGIPGMEMEAVSFVQNNLLLHLSETEATVQFTRMIQESLKSKFPRLNFFAHAIVQLKNSPSMIRGSYDDPDKLSFIPRLYDERTDGRILEVIVLAFEKWRTPEKVYMYKLSVRRVKETVNTIVYRSFEEFNELYIKLCRRFAIARLPPLSRGTGVGRSNIRSVAERRRLEIQQFLTLLYEHHPEIAHCDLVYTFFHIIFRDSVPEETNRLSQSCFQSDSQVPSSITGRIFLRISFNQQKSILSIFVGHVKDLQTINGQPPDSYVKTYLHPRMQRSTKRKTRVVKNTQMPTFNEELTYQLDADCCLNDRALEVSVWNCGSIVAENSMIGTIHIPLRRLNEVPVDRKGVKVLESWFQLNGFWRQ